jgi:magnesium and cobalt transporter
MVLAESRATLLPAGRLGRAERRFLRKLLASTSILVADILVKWESVDWIALDTPRDAAVDRVRRSGRSRLPVLDGNRVVGLVTAKDLLLGLHRPGSRGEPRDLMRPVYFVREEETIKALLGELQEARAHLAVVLDRLGRPSGIVTMEDVLEEIVGELHDEREREVT